MNRVLIFILILMISFSLTESALSQYCPRKIAVIYGDPLARKAAVILNQVYKKLGCTPDFQFLPGRRGIYSFNKSQVDGELFRLELIEKRYKKSFIRSSTPLLQLVNALWIHPTPSIAKNKPMAFVLGIAWHEKFISEKPPGRYIKFSTDQEVINAYNRGVIGGFLTEKQSIRLRLKADELRPAPIIKHIISSEPVYHYLDIKYANFMADFSKELLRNNPFTELE